MTISRKHLNQLADMVVDVALSEELNPIQFRKDVGMMLYKFASNNCENFDFSKWTKYIEKKSNQVLSVRKAQ